MAAPSYKPIRDYAMIGDGHTAALVARDGSVDWCCWPHFDSGAVFCRLLDASKAGWFRIGPAGETPAPEREYEAGTNLLVTTFRTGGGAVRQTAFMPIEQRSARRRGKELEPSHRMLFLLEGLSGETEFEVEFRPTFDFARFETPIAIRRRGAAASGPHADVSVNCPCELRIDDSGVARGRLRVKAGDRLWTAVVYDDEKGAAARAVKHGDHDLERTRKYWRDWIDLCPYDGPYADAVRRSALVLKMLIFSPTGALVAAPTTSLPERIGGIRNWDYRYTWLRDSALILHALETLGYYDEAMNFFEWLEALDLKNRGGFQIMYTIEGSSDLQEAELDYLEGYRGSRPVRIGNAASSHVQLDIYGEVLSAAYLCFTRLEKGLTPELWGMVEHLADGAARNWRKPDRSVWELRCEPRHFLYSKVMCWVALDRALKLAKRYGRDGHVQRWEHACSEVREAIFSQGYNREVGAFTQAFGSADLDAGALAVQRTRLLPPDDPRVVSTTNRILERLTENGLIYRYRNNDCLPPGEGAFTSCTFWMVDNLAQQGRIREARELFEGVVRHASDVGLLSEEIDPSSGELLGNYPQGFTHLALIRAATSIAEAEAAGKRSDAAGARAKAQ